MNNSLLKKQIKQLKQEKGVFSRKIGESKKSGTDPTEYIDKVKALSQAIKETEDQLKALKAQEATQQTSKEESELELPAQFSERSMTKQSDRVDNDLRIQLHTDPELWDQYVKQHNNATIYHSWAIKQVIEQTFGHSSFYISVINSKNNIQGVMPLVQLNSKLFGNSLISVPFFNYGGMLYSTTAARAKLLQAAKEQTKATQAEHVEFRDCRKFVDLPSKEAKVTMLLNLPDNSDVLWKQIGTKLRAQIKKAERNQLTCKIGKQELLNDFYHVFARNMRDLGTPVYSRQFFSNMLIHNESASIAIIYHQNKPVSCGFILGWRNTMEIPWASTIKSANKLDANMKLYWEILKYTTNKGYKIFDFGRSSKDANTFKFKKQWGAQPYQLYWHYYLPNTGNLPEINPNNPKFKLMIWGWKKLPIWLANILGPAIVKNLP